MTHQHPRPEESSRPLHVNPYEVPPGQHGWRGLTVPGDHKRKVYTVLHNEKILVTALLLMPGEHSLRHSHESGELSIHFRGELRPTVTWNPPGALHSGPVEPVVRDNGLEAAIDALLSEVADPRLGELARQVKYLQRELRGFQDQVEERLKAPPSPFVIVDVLFPPFKTTVDDPRLPEKKTVVGQWFD